MKEEVGKHSSLFLKSLDRIIASEEERGSWVEEALGYVNRFRGATFVIKIDGGLLPHGENNNLKNLISEIDLLHSIGINLVIVHDANPQITELYRTHGHTGKIRSIKHNLAPNDEEIEIVRNAYAQTSYAIMEAISSYTKHNIIASVAPVIKARKIGKIEGADYQLAGKIESVNIAALRSYLKGRIVPIISPLGIDEYGQVLSINADIVACRIASTLKVQKLIFLIDRDGIMKEGCLVRELETQEAQEFLDKNIITGELSVKVSDSIKACEQGVKRIHFLNGKKIYLLLLEIFTNEGVGTMIYSDPYNKARKASLSDLSAVAYLLEQTIKDRKTLNKCLNEIQNLLDDFYIWDVDNEVVGCAALFFNEENQSAEIFGLTIGSTHKTSDYEGKLIDHLLTEAKGKNIKNIFSLPLSSNEHWFLQKSFVLLESGKTGGKVNFAPPRTSRTLKVLRGRCVYYKAINGS